jgi:hypothetical protein
VTEGQRERETRRRGRDREWGIWRERERERERKREGGWIEQDTLVNSFNKHFKFFYKTLVKIL